MELLEIEEQRVVKGAADVDHFVGARPAGPVLDRQSRKGPQRGMGQHAETLPQSVQRANDRLHLRHQFLKFNEIN